MKIVLSKRELIKVMNNIIIVHVYLSLHDTVHTRDARILTGYLIKY